ncbi:MAG: IclR family transcriptional regulator [Deltaproteobacteria bacterium]|nr:IclR family transcriptional regulator [Deltaproteobacteria bacterium]
MFPIENKVERKMPPAFKRVPAIDKCFDILELLAQSKEPMGISGISGKLNLNKSTVFNIAHTLMDLNVLEHQPDGKFVFGTRFYILGNMAGKRSDLLQIAHPYLEKINEKTKLSAFLGLRSDRQVILIDKVDAAYGIKLSSEIGMQMPILAGAGIKAMLSQLSDEEIDKILVRTELKRYTPSSIIDKADFKEEILEVRKQGIAYDREEYIEGMVAFAIPVQAKGRDLQAAIWAVGLTRQVSEASMPELIGLLKEISEEINYRLQ